MQDHYDKLPLRSRLSFSHFSRLFSGAIGDLSEDEVGSDGYVIHTLEAGIWCFLNSGSYKEAVLKAVNLGEDTDTTATVAGGLARVSLVNFLHFTFHSLQFAGFIVLTRFLPLDRLL